MHGVLHAKVRLWSWPMWTMCAAKAWLHELAALYVHCDVGDSAQVNALVQRTMAQHGRIDVLVNNAGIFKAAPF